MIDPKKAKKKIHIFFFVVLSQCAYNKKSKILEVRKRQIQSNGILFHTYQHGRNRIEP